MAKHEQDEAGRRFRVLVVEDEPFVAMELKAALATGGFDVLGPVGSVADALGILEDERPDAAVLDVRLGSERVTPVAVALKALGVPFVLASASSASELAADDALADVQNLGKPTNLKQLIDVIAALPR
ncbi:response regulator [Rhizobium sp. BK251]|uniref:response regulator n=1 Tax=Rhizobium sp. BK251 TaxID=2512125 RepID=UPI001045D982|nr:response regulator [Rhizobium sp. BK251]TCL66394.1 response regulator receiver domain-containing protein [Rhizobium sp. BK251]